MSAEVELHVEERAGGWLLAGSGAGQFALVNEYLGYLADRRYSPRTVRAYAFDLLAFCRWLVAEGVALAEVTTEVLLGFLSFCGRARLQGQVGGNVYSIRDGRSSGYAAATINRRLVAIAGLFEYRGMREPDAVNPVPRGSERRRVTRGERGGLLGRSLRDRAIAGLMLYSGLRSAEVLGLCVEDVDVARGWARVCGKGGRERRVPVDREVCGLIQTYLLVERPETQERALFVVAKGPHRGWPLSPAGLRTVFRYHRGRAGAPRAHPHTLRHTFGTALAEAGIDLPVIQELLGHEHIDSSIRYIHLAPAHVRAAYDAAREAQRAQR
jgi:integrase/recombinase XerD